MILKDINEACKDCILSLVKCCLCFSNTLICFSQKYFSITFLEGTKAKYTF